MKVKLSEGAFFAIVAAAGEMYKKECYGLLVGKRRGETIKVVAVAVSQKAKRTFSSIIYTEKYIKSFREIVHCLPKCELIGEFHSHPQFGKRRGYAVLSKADLSTCCEALQIVVSANDVKQQRKDFVVNSDGTISGIINHISMHIRAFYVEDERPTRIPISCDLLT